MTVKDSTLIRIPLALKAELEAAAAEMLRAHQEGKAPLPPEFVEHVPVHFVIKRALEEMIAKKARSNAPRRKASIVHTVDNGPSGGGRVNTTLACAEGGK